MPHNLLPKNGLETARSGKFRGRGKRSQVASLTMHLAQTLHLHLHTSLFQIHSVTLLLHLVGTVNFRRLNLTLHASLITRRDSVEQNKKSASSFLLVTQEKAVGSSYCPSSRVSFAPDRPAPPSFLFQGTEPTN